MENPQVRIDNDLARDESHLLCPVSGDGYLHLTRIKDLGGEDALMVFECETCGASHILGFRQHKGFTMMAWS